MVARSEAPARLRYARLRVDHFEVIAGPLIVAVAVRKYPGRLERFSGAIVGFGLLVWLARRPALAILAIIVLMPFSGFWLGGLYALGVPTGLLQLLGLWKELAVAAVVMAAVANQRHRGWRPDSIDLAAMVYVGAVALYYVAPALFASAGTTVLASSVRNIALRTDVLFVVLFVAARHSDLHRSDLDRLGLTALTVGAAVSAIGVFEFLFPSTWNAIAVHTFRVQEFRAVVLHSPVNPDDIRVYGQVGGRSIVRIGSTLLSPISLGPSLLLPFALGIERIARQRATTRVYVAVGLVATSLLLTQTRSAIIGAIVICAIAIRPAPGRSTANRVRFALVLAGAAALALPLAGSSGLSQRTTSAVAGNESSAQDHLTSFRAGIEALAHHPLGQGLGTSPSTAQRFDVSGRVTSENYYLQVGDELGLHTMLAFVVLTVLLLRRLKGVALRSLPPFDVAAAVRAAAIGLAVGAFLLHIWQEFPVSLPFWALAGVVLAADRPPALRVEPRPVRALSR